MNNINNIPQKWPIDNFSAVSYVGNRLLDDNPKARFLGQALPIRDSRTQFWLSTMLNHNINHIILYDQRNMAENFNKRPGLYMIYSRANQTLVPLDSRDSTHLRNVLSLISELPELSDDELQNWLQRWVDERQNGDANWKSYWNRAWGATELFYSQNVSYYEVEFDNNPIQPFQTGTNIITAIQGVIGRLFNEDVLRELQSTCRYLPHSLFNEISAALNITDSAIMI